MGTDELLAWSKDARKHADYSPITRGANSRFLLLGLWQAWQAWRAWACCSCGYTRQSRVRFFIARHPHPRIHQPPLRPIHPNLRPIILAYFQSSPSSPTKSCREVQIAAEVVAVRNVEEPSVVVLVAEAPLAVPHLVAAEVAVAVSYPENRAGTCPVWRRHLSRYLLYHTTLTPC